MMPNDRVSDEAMAWLQRTNDPEFLEWEAFTDWLASDPAHADEYHRLAESERLMLPHVVAASARQISAPPRERSRPRRLAMAGGAMAASLAAALVVLQPFSTDVYRTGPGEQRRIVLADRDELLLDSQTEVAVSGWFRGDVRLAKGQVLFRLAGDKRVEVRSGDLTVTDIGTVFAVTRSGSTNRVVVDEGLVLVDPGGARLKLAKGEQLVAIDGARRLTPKPAPVGAAEAWARGQLTYLDAPVSEVVADLSRSTGLAISASTATGARRFSGTLSIADVRRNPETLGPLLGAPVRPRGDGWRVGEDG
jgi:transmembrane sensor